MKFKEANFTFTKPEGMTDEQCGSLPVYKGLDSDGFPVIISCWEVSKEDLDEIQKSGRVYLTITGKETPPVSLLAKSPFAPTEPINHQEERLPDKITSEWLKTIHPQINDEQAESLLKFCHDNTIRYQECYGRGESLFEKWKWSEKLITENCGGLVRAFQDTLPEVDESKVRKSNEGT